MERLKRYPQFFHSVVPETIMSRTVIKVVTPYAISILKYIDEFTAVSPAACGLINSISDKEVTIIPNGIELEKYFTSDPLEKHQQVKTILFIGRLEKRKGVKYLLQAYSRIMNNNHYQLLIAGDGPDRERLESLAEDLGLINYRFLGYVDETTKIKLLKDADVFCSPAVYGESFGIVLLEAMATSTVIVAGNNSGYSQLLKDEGQLSIINPHDIGEFARKLELMANNQAVRALSKKWMAKYVKTFDYREIAKTYEKFYYDVEEKRLKKT